MSAGISPFRRRLSIGCTLYVVKSKGEGDTVRIVKSKPFIKTANYPENPPVFQDSVFLVFRKLNLFTHCGFLLSSDGIQNQKQILTCDESVMSVEVLHF